MKIGIISTGDELLRGLIADTNGAWMAARLDELGFSVFKMITIGDDEEALGEAISLALDEFDLTIVGGGLGPTDDDLTARSAARAVGRALVRSEEAAGQVRAAFQRLDRPMAEVNLRQADLPEGAQVLENIMGTAPGFELRKDKGRAVFLPGVPLELKAMFERHVLGELKKSENTRVRAVLRCFGTGESNVQTALRPVIDASPDISWAFRASFPEIGVTLTAEDARRLSAAQKEAKEALGQFVFAEDNASLPEVLVRTALERGLLLGTAESCTGGLIGHSITETPGSSGCFVGGVIAYDNSVKTGILGVDQALLEEHGAVSEPVARAMALGVKKHLGCDLGLAVSGIAGPTGGSEEKPVGLVHMAVAGPRGVLHRSHVFKGMGRSRVKKISAWTVMWLALCALREEI